MQTTVEEARAWIRAHLEPSPRARFSIYSIKHTMERHVGKTHCYESVFADAAVAEGFRIKPSTNGDAVFAKLKRKVRYV